MSCLQGHPVMYGNIRVLELTGPVGHVVEGHEHNYDHMMQVHTGSIEVRMWDPDRHAEVVVELWSPQTRKDRFLSALVADSTLTPTEWKRRYPSKMLVRKHWRHTVTLLEADTEFDCVHAHRDAAGAVVMEPVADEQVRERAYF